LIQHATAKAPDTGRTYQDIPKPRAWPLLGVVPALRRDPLSFMLDASRTHGDIVAMPLGLQPAVQITHPDLIQRVLIENSANYGRSPMTDRLKFIMGEGLVTADGEQWARQRRMMQPIFQRDKLDGLIPVMAAAAEDMLARWDGLERSGTPIDVGSQMGRLALDVITRALFGTSGGAIADEVIRSVPILQEYTAYLFWTLNPLAGKFPTPNYRRFAAALAALDAIIYRFIRERMAAGAGAGDMLDALLKTRDPETGAAMTEKALRDEVITLFLAGHETTANALTWTWYLLDRNPEARERLEGEAAALASNPATAEDLNRLPYARRVAQEAMRIYPPVWMFNRLALGADTLGGYSIPQGTTVFIPPWVLHRHPSWWENPDRFDPDRFTPARSAGRPRHIYLPFGAGLRTCIGSHLALMEMQVGLASVASSYRLRPTSDHPVSAQALITTRPRTPIVMRLERRRGVGL
jgi:cytochrome P450